MTTRRKPIHGTASISTVGGTVMTIAAQVYTSFFKYICKIDWFGVKKITHIVETTPKVAAFIAATAPKVIEKACKFTCEMSTAGSVYSSITAIYGAYVDRTLAKITHAVSTSASTVTKGVSLGLKVAGKITATALGKIFGGVCIAASGVSLVDAFTNTAKSTAQRWTQGLISVTNIVGSGLMFVPVFAPIGVCLLVGAFAVDMAAACIF